MSETNEIQVGPELNAAIAVAFFVKPRLSAPAFRVVEEIARYAKRYGRSKDILRNAAADVMDGAYQNSDAAVKELKRKGLIESVRVGTEGSWLLTDYGRAVVCGKVTRRDVMEPDFLASAAWL